MRRTRGARVVAVIVTLCVATAFFGGIASRARAQDGVPDGVPPPESVEIRTPTPDELERAGVLFERSALAYDERRYDAAIALLVEAYALSHEPILVYNMARAHEGADQLEDALEAYRRYVALASDAENAPAALERITRIEQVLAERAQAEQARALEREREAARERLAREEAERERRAREAAERRAQEEARRRAAEPSPWPWVVAGSGGAVLVIGAVLGGVALDVHAAAEAAETQVDARARADEAQALATGASVTLVAGGVLLAVGAVWGVIDLTDGPGEAAAVEVAIGPGGVEVRGAF